ncbi:MAG: hypothetical protein M1830_004366, partial [Pleopsidium flavum]
NALALLARALGFSSQSVSVKPPTSSSESGAPLKSEVSPDQAGSLQQSLQGLVSQHRALVELHNICSTSATADKKKANNTAPLIERLDEYPANGIDLANLVTYPPKIEPIPVKPLFLDIAWNYIEYPGRPLKAVQSGEKTGIDGEGAKGEEKKEAKRGWFGFGRS